MICIHTNIAIPLHCSNSKIVPEKIIMACWSLPQLSFFLLSSLAILSLVCADPDPLQDFCIADLKSSLTVNGFPCKPMKDAKPQDFFFAGLAKPGNTTNIFGSNVTSANVETFPALNTLGVTMNRADFAPGGVNPPHIHPRATETVLVVKGKLLVGFVTTANVLFSKVVKAGEMFVIPRGLIHFQQNVGKGTAHSITAFNSQSPGVVLVSTTLFASNPLIPNEVLAKAFQLDAQQVNQIKSKFGA